MIEIIVIVIIFLICFYTFYPNKQYDKKELGNKKIIKDDSVMEEYKQVLKNVGLSMKFVNANFDEFSELNEASENSFLMNFIYLEVAVMMMARKKINKEEDELEFAEKMFEALLSVGKEETEVNSDYYNLQKDIFFGKVNAFLSVITKFIESVKQSEFAPGPGCFLLRYLIISAKGTDNLTDNEISKCMIIGSELDTSILQYIFEEKTTIEEKPKSAPDLSQLIDEAAERCGVPLEEFIDAYEAYFAVLQGFGFTGNSNEDINSNALELKILTEEEVEMAKSSINQAAFNRAIYKFEYPKTFLL